jgi:hypothetical protein
MRASRSRSVFPPKNRLALALQMAEVVLARAVFLSTATTQSASGKQQ